MHSNNQELCSACGIEDAFRYCRRCEAYFCSGCLCEHLSEEVTAVESDEKDSPAGTETSDVSGESTQAPTTGVSWLSNATIVGGMDDGRIKRAIQHYRTLIAILQAELLARELGGGTRPRRMGKGPQRHSGNTERHQRSDSKLHKAIGKLNAEALLKLIKIMEKKTNANAKS